MIDDDQEELDETLESGFQRMKQLNININIELPVRKLLLALFVMKQQNLKP